MPHCFFCLVILNNLYVNAQDHTLELSNVVVTAGLQEQQIKESGRNIISIKTEHLKNLPVHSVDELLHYLPGIEGQQRGPQGAPSDIVLRGGTFQQVLLIIDGLKLNDPLTGHFNSYIPINIERCCISYLWL
ncbi:MAG: Plug domain-containing protein [Chitinophagaceae bacterium]